MKRPLKIRRLLGVLLLAQFTLLNSLLQYHHSVHPSEHGHHLHLHLAAPGTPTQPATALRDTAPQDDHSACFICYLCDSSRVLPADALPALRADVVRLAPLCRFESPALASAAIPSGRSPPACG